jgi:DNA-directed RNA polymerase specialized sigma24 family protein
MSESVVDEVLLAKARKYNRAAVEAIFAENYAMASRIALGLSGRADVGMGVVRFVVKQAMRAVPAWKDDGAPERWFLHHTILTVRRAAKHQPNQKNDTLIADFKTASPEYLAFIRALRSLPMQQREAFILHHGERLKERFSAVAMDCSVIAASNHLNAAHNELRPIAGENFEAFIKRLNQTYQTLAPGEAMAVPKIRRAIVRYVWPRRIARVIGWLLLLGFIGAVAFGVKKIWPMLEF